MGAGASGEDTDTSGTSAKPPAQESRPTPGNTREAKSLANRPLNPIKPGVGRTRRRLKIPIDFTEGLPPSQKKPAEPPRCLKPVVEEEFIEGHWSAPESSVVFLHPEPKVGETKGPTKPIKPKPLVPIVPTPAHPPPPAPNVPETSNHQPNPLNDDKGECKTQPVLDSQVSSAIPTIEEQIPPTKIEPQVPKKHTQESKLRAPQVRVERTAPPMNPQGVSAHRNAQFAGPATEPPLKSFREAQSHHFPSSLPLDQFLARASEALAQYQFSPKNTLACICTCRDDITARAVSAIEQHWGTAFNCSGLAGILTIGRTGILHARRHAPVVGGRERYVLFLLPHIGITEHGVIGKCTREGRIDAVSTCGSLVIFLQELENGQLNLEHDVEDIEFSVLRQKLMKKLPFGAVPGLVFLTKAVLEVAVEDARRLLAVVDDGTAADYAVVSGILIHGPKAITVVFPGPSWLRVGGMEEPMHLAPAK